MLASKHIPRARQCAVAALIVGGVAMFAALQLQQTTTTRHLEHFDAQQFGELASTQTMLKERLGQLALVVHQIEQSSEHLSELRQSVQAASSAVQLLQDRQAQADLQHSALTAKVESLAEDMKALSLAQTKVAAPSIKLSARARKQSTPAPVEKPASVPFSLLGIETRAGQIFAVVGPNRVSHLEDVQLLRAGEQFMGWRLLRIEPAGTAVFSSNGQERSVTLH